MKKRLAIITSHPIQYNVPLFRLLTERDNLEILVFYTWGKGVLNNKYDPGFGRIINWDIPLLEGYPSKFLLNVSKDPGTHHFRGIINPTIIDELDEYNPDVILVYGWSFSSHLKVMRHYKGKTPVFFRGDSTLLDDKQGLKPMLRRMALKWIYKKVDVAFYVGRNNREYFEKAGLGEGQLVFAPHAVNNDFFMDNSGSYELEGNRRRQDLGISDNCFVFLFAGKFENKKSPLLLLEAFEKAFEATFESETLPGDIHLIFVGNGDLEVSLKARAKNKPGINRIHFIDFQNQKQMPIVYRSGDVFVLPSGGPGETWGLAINEAMACGRAVLASTRCGGAVDLIQEGVNGYIFEAGSVESLKSRMMLLVQQRTKSKEMGQASLTHIDHFSLNRLADTIEQTVLTF
ncbi:MAG TPA: glycosyltransferase family 4 protein [Puia sp.]|jgi:glycosyltransferase involved in cell wall biosynthesis